MRRGRPAKAKPKGLYTESGRKSRSASARAMTEAEALEVGLQQRRKTWAEEFEDVFGHAPKPKEYPEDVVLRDKGAGTVQGRLRMFAERSGCNVNGISKDHLEAANFYLEQRNQYQCMIESPDGVRSTPEGHTPSGDPEAYEDYCKGVKARWNAIERAIVDAVQETGERGIVSALDQILVKQQLRTDLIGELRLALNAIHKVRIGQKKKQKGY